MLKVDFARLMAPDALSFFFTLIPGLFFLGAVGIANPDIGYLLVSVRFALPFGDYTSILALLLAAFLIGATFITFVGLVRFIFGYLWGLWFSFEPIFYRRIVLPILDRLLAVPAPIPNSPHPKPKPKPRWLYALRQTAADKASPPSIASSDPAFLWWEAVTKQLLKKRCGLEEKDLPAASLQPLREILTEPSPREQHGDIMFIMLHATGWCALAATYFAPALRMRWFYIFLLFLIANGLHHSLAVARILQDPELGDTLRLRAVLREFPKLTNQTIAEPKPTASEQD